LKKLMRKRPFGVSPPAPLQYLALLWVAVVNGVLKMH
jgi:hypothetical protein